MEKEILLSEHFTYRRLIRFTLPSIVMMIFSSIYGVIDGIFVSNYIGKTPFASINLIMPFLMLFGAVGFMIGTGGSALIAKTLGERKSLKANRIFSMLVYGLIALGIILATLGFIFLHQIALWLGAEGDMVADCVLYGRILLLVLPAFILQNAFQAFFVTAEKPQLGLIITVTAGVTNILLDLFFIVIFKWGLLGAAAATAISQLVGGCIPLLYFALPNESLLRLTKTKYDGKDFAKALTNGSSEFVSNISMSIVNILYNIQLMRFIGENGVASYGVIMYVNFIFLSVFLGYSMGCAPLISFNYGAGNHKELQNLLKKSGVFILCAGTCLTLVAEILALPLSRIFVGYDTELSAMTQQGFMLYSFSFLIAGFNLFASAFFTALNNGMVSASISFSRTMIFETSAVLILPLLLGVNGIWLAIVCAELMTLAVSLHLFFRYRARYHY